MIASSTPKACVSGWQAVENSELGFVRLDESLLQLVEGFDFVPEVFEVSKVGRSGFGMSLDIDHFVNEGAEVIQGSHWREREIVWIAIQAANGAENESVFDDIERDMALVKSSGQEAVLPMDATGGCRCLAVSREHLADVIVLGDGLHLKAASGLRVPQRRTIDVDGVAVVAEAAQERLDHVAIAEEVGPFVVS